MKGSFLASAIFMAIVGVTRCHGDDHKHKISDADHYNSGEHDASYDHDAFLGKAHGHEFDSLDPKEAKRRLRDMLKKVRIYFITEM